MNRNLKTRANNGFTIVELIVVVTVIGLLAAIAVGAYNKVVNEAKVTKSLALVNTLATAKALFVADPKRMFEKSWQIKTHGMRTRVRPSCLEAGMGNIVGEI